MPSWRWGTYTPGHFQPCLLPAATGDKGNPDSRCPQGPGGDGCSPPRLSPAPAPRRAGELWGAADGADMEALSSRIQKAAAQQLRPLSPQRGPSAPAQNWGSILQVWHEAGVEMGSSQRWSCPPNTHPCLAPPSWEHRREPAIPPLRGHTESIPGATLAHTGCVFREQEEGRPPLPARQRRSNRPCATISLGRRHRCRDTLQQPSPKRVSSASPLPGALHAPALGSYLPCET